MTIKDCIDIVDNIKPNQYTIKEKVMWLSFIEAIIINEVLKTHEGYDGKYDLFEGYSEDKLSVTLIVPSPYDRLYTAYLKMKIDEENGETTRYNNSASLYNNYMAEYKKYYNKTHMPIDVTNKAKDMKPKLVSVGLSDAEYENIKRDLTFILTEYFSDAVSPDKIADVVTKFVQNNMEMLKGKDGEKGEKGEVGPEGPMGPQGLKGASPTKDELKKLINDVFADDINAIAQQAIENEENIGGIKTELKNKADVKSDLVFQKEAPKITSPDTLEIEAPEGVTLQGNVNMNGTHNIAGDVCFYDGVVNTYSEAKQWGEQKFLGDVKFPAASKPWFKNPPKIGGTSYNDPSAGKAMSITDLGTHNTIEEVYTLLNSKTSEWATITLEKTKIVNIGNGRETSISCDTDHTYTVYAQYNGEGIDVYYKTFFVFDSVHNGDTNFGMYVINFQYDTDGNITAMLGMCFMKDVNIKCSGNAWFANTPKIGGTSYYDTDAKDVMAIKDLGELSTQGQLDNMITLSTGHYKFTSTYELFVSTASQWKFRFIETENTAVTYNYEMSVISDGSQFYQEVRCDKIPSIIYRKGNANFAMYGGYILTSDKEIELATGKIKSINALTLISENPEDSSVSSQIIINPNSINLATGNFNVDASGDITFNQIPQVPSKTESELLVPTGLGMYHSEIFDVNSPELVISGINWCKDITYNDVIEEISIVSPGVGILMTVTDGEGAIGVHFDTGDVAPTIKYTYNPQVINWQGTDCALDDGISVFAPSANMHYDIYFTFMGGRLVAFVNGYVPASSNA